MRLSAGADEGDRRVQSHGDVSLARAGDLSAQSAHRRRCQDTMKKQTKLKGCLRNCCCSLFPIVWRNLKSSMLKNTKQPNSKFVIKNLVGIVGIHLNAAHLERRSKRRLERLHHHHRLARRLNALFVAMCLQLLDVDARQLNAGSNLRLCSCV